MKDKIRIDAMKLMCVLAFMILVDDFCNVYFVAVSENLSIVLHILQVIYLFYFCKKKIIKFEDFGIRKKVKWGMCIWSFVIGVIIMILGSMIQSMIPFKDGNETSSSLYYVVFFCFYASLVAPIFEEIIFRGILFKELCLSGIGVIRALLLMGCMFFLIHTGGINVGALFLALVSGIVMLWTKNILYPIIMHFAGNFPVCLLFLVGSLQQGYNTEAELVENEVMGLGETMLLFTIPCLILVGLICLFLDYVYVKFVSSDNVQSKKEINIVNITKVKLREVYFFKDFILYIGICVVASLIQLS